MITSFEIGSIFRIVDEATPALRRIREQMASLNKIIKEVRDSLAGFSKSVAPGIDGAIKSTDGLAEAWGNVSKSAAEASRVIAATSKVARESAAAASSGMMAGGGGRFRLGHRLGMGGGGLGGLGGGVISGRHFGGIGMGLAAVGAWGVDEEAKLESSF